ncbi:MAG: hypothetical protein INR65_12655, partial [Gluconacetobacter diazotrophicus]|nr:hypothetical protein [Gluconacetobacter diazotrophicus]
MSGSAAQASPARPPEVDDGGPVSLGPVLIETLAFSWNRLRSTLLVLAPMLVVLAIFETFRLPNPAIAAFLTLLMARGDAVSTMSSSIAIAIAFGLSVLISVLVLSASLS